VVESSSEHRWSLQAAREIFADVRQRTESAVKEVDELVGEREACEAGSPAMAKVEDRIRDRVGAWARAMEALGLEVKGVWLVDFDNGSGYYCWKWPEPELAYFHGYDEGFPGRVRIQ
jgi:hypothetical protein